MDKLQSPQKLFISYGHRESEICERINAALQRRGHSTWIDTHDLKDRCGVDWREEIQRGIAASDGVVACLSAYSTRDVANERDERSVCLDELAIALGVKGGSNLYTILLDDEEAVNLPASVAHREWLDMHDWREKLAAGEEVFFPWFREKMDCLFAMIEHPDNIRFESEIAAIRERLTIRCSTARVEYLLRQPFVGREWLTQKVNAWLDDPKAPRTALLFSEPGVGKSSWAAHCVHYNPRVAASVFISHDMAGYNDPRVVVQTLAYLLACRLPAYRQALAVRLPEKDELQQLGAKELFDRLIAWPLSMSIDGGHESMIFVLDGLDEADHPARNTLARTIFEFAPLLPAWLRILVLARPVPGVLAYTKDACRIALSEDCPENLADVRNYFVQRLESTFGSDPQWPDALRRMTERSQGVFLYAKMLSDLLLKTQSLTRWKDFPDGLNGVFTQWFEVCFPDCLEFVERFRPAISLILGAPHGALPVTTLCRIMDWGETELADFRLRLNVLLRESKSEFKDTTLTFCHAYIAEYLANGAGENLFFCSPADGKKRISAALYAAFEQAPTTLTIWEAGQLVNLPLPPKQKEKVEDSFAVEKILLSSSSRELFDRARIIAYIRCTRHESEENLLHLVKCLDKQIFIESFNSERDGGRIESLYLTMCTAYTLLGRKYGNASIRKEWITSYCKLASILGRNGKTIKQRVLLENIVRTLEKQQVCPSREPYTRVLLSAYYSLGRYYESENLIEKGQNVYRKGCSLAVKSGDSYYISKFYNLTGAAMLRIGNWESALACLAEGVTELKKETVHKKSPAVNAFEWLELAQGYNALGDSLKKINKLSAAITAYTVAYQILWDYCCTAGALVIWLEAQTCCEKIEQLSALLGDTESESKWRNEQLKLGKYTSIEARRKTADLHCTTAENLSEFPVGAITCYKSALHIYEELNDKEKASELQQKIAELSAKIKHKTL